MLGDNTPYFEWGEVAYGDQQVDLSLVKLDDAARRKIHDPNDMSQGNQRHTDDDLEAFTAEQLSSTPIFQIRNMLRNEGLCANRLAGETFADFDPLQTFRVQSFEGCQRKGFTVGIHQVGVIKARIAIRDKDNVPSMR